ncbi:MAG: PD-(D/E)XK nuclease family protein, partial [bacterium]
GIAVCRPEEGAFIGAKYLFFIGFVDGEFPPLEHENNILSDKELNNLGVRKPNSKFRHIHSFIRNISRKDAVITVTYPNYDGEIKKIPSVFVFPFVDASEKLRPALDNAHFGYQIALGKRCSEIYVSGNRIKEDKIVVPEHIKHSIETQFVRYFRPAINNYTGVISKEVLEDPTVRMAIYSEKLSVTGIERYIECPFRFFVENILKLNRIMVPAPELTPLSFGALIHKILKEFYLRRLKKIYGCSMPNLSEIDDYEHLLKGVSIKKENIAEVRDELSSIVDEIIDEEISHSFHHLVGFYKKRLKTILGAFLELEMKTNRGLPFLVEAGFGSSRGYAFSISDKPYPIGSNIVISGVIDRLELVNNKKIILVDYKTGEPPSKTDILRGVKIQLPLYALAIKNILSGTKLELAGLAVYSFSPKRVEVKRGPVIGEFERGERTDLDELIAMTEEIVMTVSQKIVAGEFHYNFDDESNCRNCDLNHICKLEYLEYPLSFNFEDKSSNTIPVKELVKIIERM